MSNLRVDVVGFDELVKKIKLLASDKDKKREMLVLLRQIAKPTLSAAKTLVPVQRSYSNLKSRRQVVGGTLKKSLGYITGKKGNSAENPTIYVGPRVKGKFGGWYGHMVEAGHNVYNNPNGKVSRGKNKGKLKSVLARKTHKNPGSVSKKVEGKFFLKASYEQTKGTVTADAEKKFAKFIQRRIDKLS